MLRFEITDADHQERQNINMRGRPDGRPFCYAYLCYVNRFS